MGLLLLWCLLPGPVAIGCVVLMLSLPNGDQTFYCFPTQPNNNYTTTTSTLALCNNSEMLYLQGKLRGAQTVYLIESTIIRL